MVAKVAERSHSEITFLKDCGVHFDMHAGTPRVIKIAGHRYSRHVYGTNWSGRDLVLPLKRRAMKVGVRFTEQVFVTRLMAAEDRICGAAGITAGGQYNHFCMYDNKSAISGDTGGSTDAIFSRH